MIEVVGARPGGEGGGGGERSREVCIDFRRQESPKKPQKYVFGLKNLFFILIFLHLTSELACIFN
jgi:hypothetical protein